MMGRQTGDQSQLFYLFNLERRIPAGHLLRRINPVVTRILIELRDKLASFYSEIGRPLIDPELMIRMLIDVSFLSESGTAMFIPVAEEADKALCDKFAAAGIPVREGYSSEEAGHISAECPQYPETFHVAQSNVIVETENYVDVGGNTLGRVLITSLHSYATPLVRYDVGDIATLMERCPCGHDGPALANIYGQKKRLLKRADGSVVPFSRKAGNIFAIVKCDEYRIRQTELSALDVEIGGIDYLRPASGIA